MKLSVPLVVQSQKAAGMSLPCEAVVEGHEDCPAATQKKHLARLGPAALLHYKCHASDFKCIKFISPFLSAWQQLSL